MPTLPDWTSLGSSPSGNSGRPISTTKDVSEETSRTMLGNAAAARESWSGLERLGAGLEKVGNAAVHMALIANEKAVRLDNAKAEADLSGGLTDLRKQLSVEPDQNALRTQYQDKAKGVLELVSQNIANPEARQLFIARNSDKVNSFGLMANDRANTLYREEYRAGLMQTREGLMKAFIDAKDNSERQLYLKQYNDFLDAAAQNGVIDADDAVKDMNAFTKGASKSYILAQPPERRLELLGGVRPGEVAAKDLAPTDVALLNAIAGPESGGRYNVRYTPGGGADFSGYDRHPNIKEVIQSGPNAGKTSDAAGRYQFLSSTWGPIAGKLGISDFSPENQDRAALYLAKSEYNRKTGRDLDADLKTSGFTPEIAKALSDTWEGLKVNPNKAMAAYKATIENKVDLANARDFITDPHAAVLPPEEHREMLHGAYRDYNLETQQRYLDRKNAEAAVNQKIGDDWASITTAGKPIDSVTPEEVGRAFGPQRRQQFERDRQIGLDYWAATRDFDQLNDGEIRQRLDMIDPRNHEGEGAKTWEKLYRSAQARAKEIIKLRAQDPAAAADRLPDVAAAKERVDLGGDVSAQRDLVKARLKAFDVMGIPPERQVPVTRQEAKDLIAPVEQSLPGQERKALSAVVTKIRDIYGDDLTDTILGFSLETAKVDRETAQVAASVFKKLGLGQKPAPADVSALTEAQTNAAMKKVAEPPMWAASPNYGGLSSPDAFVAQNEKAAAAAQRYPLPSDGDIRLLIQQPSPARIQQFDTIYGPGAANRVMGAANPKSGNS